MRMSLRISFFQDNGRYLRLDYTFLSTMEFFTNDLARPCCSLLANRNGKKLQRRCTPSLAVNKQRNEPRENTNDREKKQYPYYSRLQNLFVDPRCLRSISGFTITRVETPRSRIYLLVLPGSLTWPRELSRISYANRCAFPTNRPICKTRLRSARMVDSIAFFSFFFLFFVAVECGSDTETTGSRYATAYLWENAVHAISSLIYTDVVIYWREKWIE